MKDKQKKDMTYREFNTKATLLGSLLGVAIPQNKEYSEKGNEPIPDDIRANKKDGNEYITIGDAIKKRKIGLIIILLLCIIIVVTFAVIFWSTITFVISQSLNYNNSGITECFEISDEQLNEISKIDSEVIEANKDMTLGEYHVKGNLILTVKKAENGKWVDINKIEITPKNGYLFINGTPASNIEIHVIADEKSTTYKTDINDNTYNEEEDGTAILNSDVPINKEKIFAVFCNFDTSDDGSFDVSFYNKLEKNPPEESCYIITALDSK